MSHLRVLSLLAFCVALFPPRFIDAQPIAVSFTSTDGTPLSGTVFLPPTGDAVAAIVYVAGAGPTLRDSAFSARLAQRGIVVLTYDKRGVGRSGGRYEDENNVSAANLTLLAADARSALTLLRRDARWRDLPHGYVGYSQAGWVVPIALAEDASPPDFFALLSGPMCTTSEQLHFQRFAESHDYNPSRWTEEDVQREMRVVRVRPDDVDPAAFLRESAVPGLWLFGGRDVYVPVQHSVRRIQRLTDHSPAQLEHRVFADSGHDLTEPRERDAFEVLVQFIVQRAGTGSR